MPKISMKRILSVIHTDLKAELIAGVASVELWAGEAKTPLC